MNCKNLIKKSGLLIRRELECEPGQEVFIEADHIVEDNCIGRYLILFAGAEYFLTIAEEEDIYRKFEVENIEPLFFDAHGDLRWNLYLVFLLTDADFDLLPEEKIAFVERGKRYARKLVLPKSQFLKFIPVASRACRVKCCRISDPKGDWFTLLEPDGLSFCLQDFSEKRLRAYLEGHREKLQTTDCRTGMGLRKIENRVPGPEIKKLVLGEDYRPHCFGKEKEFNFSKVNLIEGQNGTGKTSLLDAIELAMTGEVQRERLGSGEQHHVEDSNYGYVKVILKTGEEMDSVTRKECLQQESRFCGPQRLGMDVLDQAFHRYNYFSSEAVHNFCFNKTGRPELEEQFASIIFGEQLINIEKNWRKYASAFREYRVRLQKDMQQLKKEFKSGFSLPPEVVDNQLSPVEIESFLQKIVLKLPGRSQYNHKKSPHLWITEVYEKLVELDSVSEFIDEMKPKFNADTYEQLLNLYECKKEKINQMNTARENAEQKIKRTAKLIADNRKRVDVKEEVIKELSEKMARLEEAQDEIAEFETLLGSPGKMEERLELEEKIRSLNQKIKVLDHFSSGEWREFLKIEGLPAVSEKELINSARQLERKISDKGRELKELVSRIKSMETQVEKLEQIISQIKVLGKKYLREKPGARQCPLCGTSCSQPGELLEIVCSEPPENTNLLYKLREKEKAKEEEIEKLKLQYTKIVEYIKLSKRLFVALQYLNKTGLVADTVDSLLTLNKIKQLVASAVKERPVLESKLNELNSRAQLMELEGISPKNISRARDFLNNNPVFKLLDVQPEKCGSPKILLENKIKKIRFLLKRQEQDLKRCRALLGEYGKQMHDYQKIKTKLEEDMRNFSLHELDLLEKYIQGAEKILKLGVEIRPDFSLSEWRVLLKEAIKKISEALKGYHKLRDDKFLARIRQRLWETEKQVRRSGTAVNILEQLKPVSQYSKEFLEQNIKTINDCFHVLHFPREFEGLSLEEGKVIALRRGSGDRVFIHRMSAGQRAAVALAVFFTMHLSMPAAPRFILLDEPVNNMDDMNVLGLLDFLKQLTVSAGSQIFFTTASAVVATLFRRKFSFLRENFRSFQLIRMGKEQVRVKVRVFSPEEEEGDLVEII